MLAFDLAERRWLPIRFPLNEIGGMHRNSQPPTQLARKRGLTATRVADDRDLAQAAKLGCFGVPVKVSGLPSGDVPDNVNRCESYLRITNGECRPLGPPPLTDAPRF